MSKNMKPRCPCFPSSASAALIVAGVCIAGCKGAMHTGKLNAGGAGADGSVDGGDSPGAGGTAGDRLVHGGAGGGGSSASGGQGGNPAGGAGNSAGIGGQSGAMTAAGGLGGWVVVGMGGTWVGGAGGSNTGGLASGFGGGGGSAVGGGSGTVPIIDRPAVWTPPFTTPLAAPGWQQSTTPICDTNQGSDSAIDVWADERGVFALLASSHSDGRQDTSVQLNGGSGWQPYYRFASDEARTVRLWGGFPGSSLLVTGEFGDPDGLAFLDQNGWVFQKTLLQSFGLFAAGKDASGADRAYIVSGTQLLKYAGGNWSTVGEGSRLLMATWADDKIVVAVGPDQTVLMGPTDDQLAPVAGVPAGDYMAVWGFSSTDIWLGNSGGQLVHFDGSKWQPHDTGSRTPGGILQLWGDSGILYFSTAAEFGRWNGSSVEILLKPPADVGIYNVAGTVGRFWGRSAKEVFIPVRDSTYKNYVCGTAFMLWFDGVEFHSF